MGLLFPLKIKWLSLPNGKDRRDLPSPHFLCRSMRSQTSCIHTKALFSDALLASEILPMFFHTFKQQLVRFAFSCWISLVKTAGLSPPQTGESTRSDCCCEVPGFSQLSRSTLKPHWQEMVQDGAVSQHIFY